MAGHRIVTGIVIHAAPERVWAVLTDFPAYPQWNPFVVSVTGKPQAGERLVISLAPPGGRGMVFKPLVLTADPPRELRWRGRLLVPGLFDGEHYFRLEPQPGGTTKLVHGEDFSGLLVPMSRRSLEQGTRAGFVLMNEALKKRAES